MPNRKSLLSALVCLGWGAALAATPPPPAAAGVDAGEVPAIVLERAHALLVARDPAAAAAQLVAFEAVTWPDGGLGCASPREVHTQLLVPGYRLRYALGERRFEVHASSAGEVRLCGQTPARLRLAPRPIDTPPPAPAEGLPKS
jgi:hypothetical protein